LRVRLATGVASSVAVDESNGARIAEMSSLTRHAADGAGAIESAAADACRSTDAKRPQHPMTWRAPRLGWSTAAIAVLAWALLRFDGSPNWDGEEVLVYAMIALGFPSSLVAVSVLSAVHAMLDSSAGIQIATSRAEMLLSWSVMAAIGYLQWFTLVPWLVGVLRRWRESPLRRQ
jgi:hypothetical protein